MKNSTPNSYAGTVEFQVFEHEQFGKVSTMYYDGELWLIGKEITSILGYSNSRKALIDHVDAEDKNTVTIRDGIAGNPNKTIINESGLYSLILSSKLPQAKDFRRWITSVVLPSIGRHGAYITGGTLQRMSGDPNFTESLVEARRISKEGAPICMFIDWRQLPSMTDALQWAGWIWRGTLVWDKTNSRPQRGRFRQQAEFVVWGSNGHMPADRQSPVLPGVYRQSMPAMQKRIHQTEKPLGVMRDIVRIVEPGEIILDPFAGAGTTVLAAKLEGYPAVGIELSPYFAKASQKRVDAGIAETS